MFAVWLVKETVATMLALPVGVARSAF